MPSKADVKAWKAQLVAQAEQQILKLTDSDRFKQYLNTLAKFHHYSARNIDLIYAQNPQATQVAGFKQWQKAFNRTVKRCNCFFCWFFWADIWRKFLCIFFQFRQTLSLFCMYVPDILRRFAIDFEMTAELLQQKSCFLNNVDLRCGTNLIAACHIEKSSRHQQNDDRFVHDHSPRFSKYQPLKHLRLLSNHFSAGQYLFPNSII